MSDPIVCGFIVGRQRTSRSLLNRRVRLFEDLLGLEHADQIARIPKERSHCVCCICSRPVMG
jgi:hypothetical protein